MEKELDTSTPLKAIKSFCLQCVGYQQNEVKKCTSPNCPLYKYRLGHGESKSKREYTEEERKAIAERLKQARKSL